MKRVFIKTVIATVALAAMGIASAQEKTIKFANQNAAGHPIVQGMEKFKEIVEKNSGGKLKVNVFPGGALGSKVTRLALEAGHAVTAVVRSPAKLGASGTQGMGVAQADLSSIAPQALADIVSGHDALVNTAGFVTDGARYLLAPRPKPCATTAQPLGLAPAVPGPHGGFTGIGFGAHADQHRATARCHARLEWAAAGYSDAGAVCTAHARDDRVLYRRGSDHACTLGTRR